MAQANNYENVWCPAKPQAQYPNYYYIIEVEVKEQSWDTSTNKSTLYLEADITGHQISFSGSDDQYLEVYWYDSKNGEKLGATTTIKSINQNETKKISGTIQVEHNDDGTLSGKAYTIWGKNGTNAFVPPVSGDTVRVEAPLTLTTIPRKSVPSVSGTTNIGNTVTINTNRKSNTFTHTLSYSFGSLTNRQIATNVGEKLENWLIPTDFYAEIPNATSGTMTLTCTTYNGSTPVGTETINVPIYVNTNSAKTTISNVTWTIDSTTNTKTGATNKYIKNFSTITVKCGSVTNSFNSPIRSIILYKIIGTNETPIETKSYSSSTTSYSNVSFTAQTGLSCDSLKVRAVDARGIQSDLVTVGIQYVNYVSVTRDTQPTIVRTSQTGSVAKITSFKGNYWNGNFGALQNSLTIRWRYRTVGGSYGSWYTIPDASISKSNNQYSITNYTFTNGTTTNLFTYTSLYDIEFEVKDGLKTVSPNTVYRLSRGIPNFVIFQNKTQRNGNDVVSKNELLNLIYPIGSIYMSINSTNPSTLFGGTWTRLPKGKFLYNINSDSASWGNGNSTGTTTNSHTLTVEQIPSHTHTVDKYYNTAIGGYYVYGSNGTGSKLTNNNGINATGGGQGHSHNIPYISVYMWRRTA